YHRNGSAFSCLYPEYKEQLDSINNRFIDLATPFLEGLIYDTRMQGNYTLKKLVDIVSDYSYSNLDIDDGMSAVYNWRDIDNVSESDSEKIINNLKDYLVKTPLHLKMLIPLINLKSQKNPLN
ncbi:MAG: DUF2779 domain-containing protein, partial [Methanobacteriaceae archaeon]|nr:DUF2779 domain-containing protein [Methanobacteriaceae archaeon]